MNFSTWYEKVRVLCILISSILDILYAPCIWKETYTDDDKIKAGPSTCEVSPQAESYPLEYHLDEEKHRKHQVDDFQNKH